MKSVHRFLMSKIVMFGETGGDPFSGLPAIASVFLVQKTQDVQYSH